MKQLGKTIVLTGSLVSALTGLPLVGCGSNSSSSGAGETGGSGSEHSSIGGGTSVGLVDVNSPGGSTSLSSRTAALATDDANCGATTTELKKKPADLLMVLDRSSSMTRAMDSAEDCDADSTTCSQRWATMISSLTTVLEASPADVYWGLKFFTSPTTTTGGRGTTSNRCYVADGVEVAVAPDNATTIQTRIAQAGTASSTPTRLAIEAAVTYLDGLTDDNSKFILLATDGEPNCAPEASNTSDSDLEATTTAVQNAAAAGYKVFVIGVGPEASNLTALAQAGGTDHFYSASTPAELSSALTTIVGTVAAGCTYPVESTKVVDPNAIGVYLDKALVPQSGTDGWSIDSSNTTITIHGSYCDDLTSGEKNLVQIFLPCKAADPIPPVLQ